MRRRLEVSIPIVLLAVLVQLMAPIAAFRVVAYATTDPLYVSSICSHTVSPDSPTEPAGEHDHGDCCAFCGAGHGGGAVAVAPPAPIFINLQRQYQQVSWLEAVDAMPTIRVGSNTQARAPPQAA